MARARPVSRQYIQTLVNQLAGEGYVQTIDNPVHKGSPLVRLTTQGKKLLDEMNEREAILFEALQSAMNNKQVKTAAEVLRIVRQLLESNDWKQRLTKPRRAKYR